MGKHYKDPKLKIFSLSSNRPLAEKIAEAVGLELGKISISRFSDGEVKVNVEESIRGRTSTSCNRLLTQSMTT